MQELLSSFVAGFGLLVVLRRLGCSLFSLLKQAFRPFDRLTKLRCQRHRNGNTFLRRASFGAPFWIVKYAQVQELMPVELSQLDPDLLRCVLLKGADKFLHESGSFCSIR